MQFGSHFGAAGLRAIVLASVGVALFGPSASPDSTPFERLPVTRGTDEAAPTTVVEQADDDGRAPREWRLVMGKDWQIVHRFSEAPHVTDEREGNRGACPLGMVEVRGRMKRHPDIDALQLRVCTRFVSDSRPERCTVYDRERWLRLSRDLPTEPMAFCIDRFEYPNRKGDYPVVMTTWYEARDACNTERKRLCTEDEWTFACEGEEATPYATGYLRDADACVIDRSWKPFDVTALAARTSRRTMAELDRLWQGEQSGSHPFCRSSFGVYDLTGNVDEWTRSSVPNGRQSVLKGGYWGPVRARCRPATRAHDEGHSFYQQGFRCCTDVPRDFSADGDVASNVGDEASPSDRKELSGGPYE
jgi:hypothetical protein